MREITTIPLHVIKKLGFIFFLILRMQQTGWEPPEKDDGKKSGEKSFQSILQKCGVALFAPSTAFLL